MPRDAPWDIDRPGTQFALACDIEIFPNMNNVVHLAFMTIYPRHLVVRRRETRPRGPRVTSWGPLMMQLDQTLRNRITAIAEGNEKDSGRRIARLMLEMLSSLND